MPVVQGRYRIPTVRTGYDKTATYNVNLGIFIQVCHMGGDKVRDLIRKVRVQLELKRFARKQLSQPITCGIAVCKENVRSERRGRPDCLQFIPMLFEGLDLVNWKAHLPREPQLYGWEVPKPVDQFSPVKHTNISPVSCTPSLFHPVTLRILFPRVLPIPSPRQGGNEDKRGFALRPSGVMAVRSV